MTDRGKGGTCQFSSAQISPSCCSTPPSTIPADSPLLHLGSDDSIGSSFKRISIREAVVCTSLQSYQRLSILPSLFLSLSLHRFLVQVHSCAALHLSVSRDRWRIFPGYQQRRAEMPTVWERKVRLPTDTWCHFRMERAGWLSGRPPGHICCFERGKSDNDFEKKKGGLVITCWLSKCHNFFPSALKLYNKLITAHF